MLNRSNGCNKGRVRLRQLSFLALVMVATGGCDYRSEKNIQGDPRPTQVDTRQISYRIVNERVLGPRCVTCHGTSGGVSLQTYEEVIARLDRIKVRVIIQRDMPKPPKPGPTQAEVDLLAAWIQAGAPRDPINPVPSPSPSPTPSPEPSWEPIVTTFEGIHTRILKPRCAGCHNPDDHTELDDLQFLIDLGLVVPGDPIKSELFRRVTLPLDDPDHMPPEEWLSHEELTAMHAFILHLKPSAGVHR